MRKLISICFASFIIFGVSAQERVVIDKVVAKVGTETILLSDVESQYSYALEQNPDPGPELKCNIIQSLIGQKLIVHQAKLDSIEISPDEIEANLNFRIEGVLRQMGGDEAFFEEYYGMTINKMRENLREDLEQQMLAERMQSRIMNDVIITPREVKEFFYSIPADSLPYLNAEVEVAEIVIKPEVNDTQRLLALKQIINIREKILSGEAPFEEMAKKYSDDPGSSKTGGDLGFASRGSYVQEFEATAYGLEEGELSEPVETEFGFHIIKLITRQGNRLKLSHILIKPEITEEDKEKAKNKLDSVRTMVINGEMTFQQAVKRFSQEDIPSYHNNGLIQNPNSGKTTFETAELPTEIYFAIEEMEVGDVSPALEYPLPTGETYYRIIQLKSKSRPHKASLEEDYTKILNYAKESKKAGYFANWLEEKMENTFIEIDHSYISCPKLNKLLN